MNRFVWVMALLVFQSATAQTDDSGFLRKIADNVLSSNAAYENLRALCKTVGPRLAGSSGMVKAEAWGQKALRDAGADKVWLQECAVPNWVRGNKDEAWYSSKDGKTIKKTPMDILALGNSMGTDPKGIFLPAILINDFNELEARKAELAGKIVVFNNIFDPKNLSTFKSYGESGAYRVRGASMAAKYGAKAVLVRSITASTDNNPHTGSLVYDTAYPKIPAAAMGLKDADALIARLKAGEEVYVFYRSEARFLPDAVGHNVIGELTGSEFPDQYITVGGHLDSWDPAEGAHDDGAGCVHSIEVLRALKAIGYKPRYTLRVVLFANEENGMRGGNKYAEEAKAKGEKHVFALESDAGGFTPRSFGFTASLDQLRNMRAWVSLFEPYGVYQFNAGGGGADIGPLNRLLGTPMAGLNPDNSRYFDLHHARGDVFENVNKRELDFGALNMAMLIYMVDKYGL
ncbi:M20/M25/M40 family metallo-hydrolase [Flavihumibacter profundi]|uniref:M20/M25/M40 family metallo-hydrolase n=1 Tax=Flavihumibacter profundi TaxID=2716883 RepID=UPI001CC6A945|nr:M20/M25/M40 family metallo-hydrolase [Flavihumibacter profundi]MBZ5858429.1 M20/M25/M40 family metallo-hydrolase [Flavihumibacter profundi]